MLGRRRGAFRILAIAVVLLLPVIAAVDLVDEELMPPKQTFEDKFDLMYTYVGPSFDTRDVDTTGNMGPYTSLELDQSDRPHISYYDATNGDLRYVRRTASGWLIQIVDASGDVGLYTSLALDSNDLPHISYYRKSTGDLRYAWSDGNQFHTTDIDVGGDTGLYTSIALDRNDTPLISYYHKSKGALMFARLNGTEWELEELDNVGDTGLHTSLALDLDDNPHITYYDATKGDLRFIEWNGSAWQEPRTIDAKGDVGLYSSLALSPNGLPHVSYFDKTHGDLKFTVFGDRFVDTQIVDSNGIVGMYTSLALDSEGKAQISYYDKTKGDLKWAHGMGFDWVHPDVHNDGDTGLYTSLDLDSNDRAHISHAGPASFGSSDPKIGMDCDREDSCSYVHMVWMEYENVARNVYQRIYYKRSSDKGKTWETPIRPISGAWRHFGGYPNSYRSGPPSISVVGRTIHVVWAHEYPGGFGNVGIYYQRSDDNGETWLTDEVRIDDIPTTGMGAMFPDYLEIYADENDVNAVWQGGAKIFRTRSSVAEATSRDGWMLDFGKYSSLAVDPSGSVFIASWDENGGNLILSASPGGGAFDTKIIDGTGNVGQHSSIALTRSDNPYPIIAYYEQDNGDLKLASWNGTDWEMEVVDASGDVGQYASLVLDSSGYPNIAYYDSAKGDLRYARWNGTAWLLETVDDFGDVGQYASLKLDSMDNPKIGYYNATKRALNMAWWNGTEWTIQEVDSGGVGEYCSMDLASGGEPHLSYFDEGNSKLKYAYLEGSDWKHDHPDDSMNAGEHTSIVLNASNSPHISYYDSEQGRLKYARKIGQNWAPEALDSAGTVGRFTSIGLDQSDDVYIGYYDETNKRLKVYSTSYAWRVQTVQRDEMVSYPMYGAIRMKYETATMPDISGEDGTLHLVYYEKKPPVGDLKFAKFNGTDWHVEVVDSEGIVGLHTSLELDSQGNVHIAYFDETETRLKYARWNGTAWSIETIDEEGDVGRECSLELDSKGNPHITYMDVTNGPMRYAWSDGQQWHVGIVGDVAPAAGWYNSLALDSMDNPHVSYFSWANLALKYAFFDGTKWVFRHVDSKGWQQNSLALDSNDQPHIAYIDRSELALKYTYWDGNGWVMKIIDDSSRYVGTYANLALTQDDEPLIAYYDETLGDMKFARPWYPASHTSQVDHANRVGLYASMALDEYRIPHMSYYDYSEGALKYAKWVPGGWSVETVDIGGDVGLYTSIALDANGYPHISYYDDSSGDGLYYTQAPVSGDGPWTAPVTIRQETRIHPEVPNIDVEGQTVHVVWADFDENTDDTVILYRKSEDGGKTWPGTPTKVSDDTPLFNRYHTNPQVQVVGATVHVMWERREMIAVGMYNMELVYDVNRWNGEPMGWGVDRLASPNPPVYPRFTATQHSMRVVGNDQQMTWMFWDGADLEQMEFTHEVDEFTHIGNLVAGIAGAAGVHIMDPSTLKSEIVLIGGETISGFLDNVTLVDPNTGAQESYCNLPIGLAYASAVSDGEGSVFVFGGLSSNGAEASILMINFTTSVPADRCTDTGISFPTGIYATSAVYDSGNDTAYIFGGVDGTGSYVMNIMAWPKLGAPSNLGIMPSARAFTSAVWVEEQGVAFIFGGESGPSQLLDEVVLFNPGSMIPEAKVLSFAKLPTERSGTSAAYDGTYAYIIGGRSPSGSISEIVRFNPNGDWKNGLVVMCPELPMAVENSSAAMSVSGRSLVGGIFIVGGRNQTSFSTGIWRYVPSYWGLDSWGVSG